MSVYSKQGSIIDTVYDSGSQAASQVYDANGHKLIYPISNVVSYYRDATQAVEAEISALSDDWENIVFLTDPHGNGNKQHSQNIALYLISNAKIKMLVLGGDYSNGYWSKTEYDTYMAGLLAYGDTSKIYALMGNHEVAGESTAVVESKACIYDDFLDTKTLNGSPENTYYYIDNPKRKVRWLFINTSDSGSSFSMSQTEITWIAQSVALPDSTWQLVVFGHVTLAQIAGVTTQNETNGSSVISAINNCNGTVVGYFCGHQHIDYCEKIGSLQHMTMLCDKFENVNYYDGISVTNRVADTITEQAVSVLSFNFKQRRVVLRRIGAGWPSVLETMQFLY